MAGKIFLFCAALISFAGCFGRESTTHVDISKAANARYTDRNGAGADLSDIGNVGFAAPSSKAEGAKNVIELRNGERADIKLPAAVKAKYLNILHTEYGARMARGTPTGRIVVRYSDGSEFVFKLVYAIDVMDNALGQKRGNATPIKLKKNDWLYKSLFVLDAAKPVLGIVFESANPNVVWTVAAAKFSDKADLFSPESEGWVKLDMEDLVVKKGSALDMSASFKDEGESGKNGRLRVSKDGRFIFENVPDVPSPKFQGTVWYMYFENMLGKKGGRDVGATKRNLSELPKIMKRHGYNMLRFHMLSVYGHNVRATKDEELDLFDHLMAEMKKNGIYLQLILLSNDMGLPPPFKWEDKTDIKIGMILGEKRVRDQWKKLVEFQLNHVNPYTSIALKDDPMVLSVEPWNEFDLALLAHEWSASQREAVEKAWRGWLKEKYSTIENLSKSDAWKNLPPVKSFDDIIVAEKSSLANLDWAKFFTERASETFEFMENFIRKDLGYRGLITNLNHNTPYLYLYRLASIYSQYQALNPYLHMVNDGVFADEQGKCNKSNPLYDAVSRWRCATAKRNFNRPVVLTEYNTRQPSPYKFLNGMIFGGYSAFQNFGYICIQDDPVRTTTRQPAYRIKVHSSGVLRAGEFIAHCLFTRGDLAPSKHRVEVVFPKGYCDSTQAACRGVNDAQSRIALMCGFGVRFEGEPIPEGLAKEAVKAPDMTLAPVAAASSVIANIGDVSYASDGGFFDLQAAIAEMKNRGILTPDNISDAAAQIYQSDTKEITMRVNDEVLKIETPKTEVVSLKKGACEKLKNLNVVSTSVNASVGVSSVDGKNIADSKRLVFVYATDNLPSKSIYTADRTLCLEQGGLPTVMQPGVVKAELRLSEGGHKIYALALNGERREEIPARYSEGKLAFEIDNAAFREGGKVFFEIVKE